ncbi:MFS transporter [Pseudomonas benzenivorans]|uniref:MFS transporter n=1 Tax=Pseudomonas benzenivorans TaxID=556533 RepID=A0ABY5HA70_9PSED|nr:MFS transporter [Pseudomonas benzenivorans]UTW09237.1 MFS transporter [Pseudomonas benzenivorans]
MFQQTVRSVWPLFFGLGIIGLCIGAQNTLLGIRAELEGFDTRVTGLLMSGYYAGFLLGSLRAPAIIQRVGHVRAFAALTALASMTILIHSIWVDPWVWGVMRLLTGFSVSAIYVVAESWLNQAADNRTRGQLLSLYMITMLAGLSAGQFLLNISDPASFELFTLISILISLAALPILITATPMPSFEAARPVSIATLYRLAPTGLVGSFLINACYAMVLGMGSVYASRLGMQVSDISLFMALLVVGGMLLQWPLGRLSDTMDRRTVIAAAAGAAVLFAMASALVGFADNHSHLLLALLFGGSCFPLLALYLALTNDQLEADQATGASSTLLLLGSVGASIGPFMVSLTMEQWGPASFFWSLAVMAGLMVTHALYKRISDPFPVTSETPTHFQMQAPLAVGSVLMESMPSDSEAEATGETAEDRGDQPQSPTA